MTQKTALFNFCFLLLLVGGLLVSCQQTTPPTLSPLPTPIPTLLGGYPPPPSELLPLLAQPNVKELTTPLCAFTTEEITTSDALLFEPAEPTFPFTTTGEIGLDEWLNENEILLTSTYNPTSSPHHIQTLNLTTGAVTTHASLITPLIGTYWLPDLQAVAYETYRFEIAEVTRLSSKQFWMASDPAVLFLEGYEGFLQQQNAHNFVYFKKNQLQQYDVRTKKAIPLPINQTVWVSRKIEEVIGVNPYFKFDGYRIAWQPAGEMALFYQFPVIFLHNLTTQTTCEIDLGQDGEQFIHPTKVQWSPSGRYVALLTTAWESHPLSKVFSTQLTVIDIQNNKIINFLTPEQQHLSNLAWHPSGSFLAITASEQPNNRLFILEVETGNTQLISPPELKIGIAANQLSWSPDGALLAAGCPELQPSGQVESSLCLFATQPK